ncbi:sugar ABC transporter substrate-binding protein [Reticulibacter mediterranei]|uniref:Sugar ABC transporter substrate-binding protein n=1 Tax=Reticulibacter mediterranei TaxID=2778369 RepID=A0A8J3IHZ1_9CHLR|nr:sugar ABC transporter substrate-binding protein [Reticulibacter mediterranei]GHO90586.1 sugar ABC transporter substrate-binding protein [Reticulibacter mediterranei]
MRDTIRSSPMNRRCFLETSALTLGSLAGASTLLNGCTTILTPESEATLTVMYGVGELSHDQVAEFEQQTGITVTQLEYDATRLNAMLAAGIPPDFIRTQGAPEVPNLVARDLVLDLTPYFEKSTVLKAENLEPVNDVYRWDRATKTQGKGPRYGMAKDWSQDVMLWYNKKVFDQAKVPYPSATQPLTYNELLDVAKQITVRQGDRVAVYGLDATWGFIMQGHLLQMLGQKGETLFSPDFTQARFNSPAVKDIFKWYVDWAQAHVGPSPLNPEAAGSSVLFASGRLGMVLFGYWFGGSVISAPKEIQDTTGFAPAPQWGSERISACMAGTGAWIPKNARHPDEAWKFMEYFMGDGPAKDRAQSGWGLPALKSLTSLLPQKLPYQKSALQAQQAEYPYLKILQFSPYANYNGIEALITKYIEPVMRGQTSLDAACDQLNAAVNKLLQQGISLTV